MSPLNEKSTKETAMRASMDARLPLRLKRAERVKLQHFIPNHWFAAAASECASMFIDGYFYGAISVAQAYIEALTRYLAQHHRLKVGKDVETRCDRLAKAKIISDVALNAALEVMEHRNDFHHLNKEVPKEYGLLEERAELCVNNLHVLESEIFEYSFVQPGKLSPKKPEYWPEAAPGRVQVCLRNLL